ncbi:MAG TPA: flagellar basal-body MS-ring/collar protein FliF [Terriglobales bacterium]|nr:flagellar basal-body MS-ring/collar protein FliF [Terriglobales bacterium]
MDGDSPLSQGVGQIRELIKGLTSKQQALLVGGAVLVGITLWLFVGMIGKPKYATLYSGLKPGEAQALGSKLAAKNIPYQLSADGGSLLVPAEQLDASRLETASQGLPRNARLGFELFDSPNWAGSDFTEKVNYQRALEGELERTLQTLSEVDAVRVHLVLPRESLFREREHEAKAAVIIKMRGGQLSQVAQLAIPQLVASAVDGLRPENVTVVDADSNNPLVHNRGPDGKAGFYALDEELGRNLVVTLEPVVGAEHVRASVHVEYDSSSSENTEELYDPKAAVTLNQQKSEETSGGANPAGVPGTASNLPPTTPATVSLTSDTQSSRSESTTFAVSKSVRHTLQPPGRMRRIAAAVLVDDATEWSEKDGKKTSVRRKRTAEEMKQIEQLAAAALGIDAQRGDLLAIQNLSFQQEPLPVLSAPGKIEKTRQIIVEWSGLLRYVGILALFVIVYFLILRPVKKQVMTAFRELPQRLRTETAKLAGAAGASPEIELPAGVEGARRAALLKRQLTEKVKAEPATASRLVQTWIREGETR